MKIRSDNQTSHKDENIVLAICLSNVKGPILVGIVYEKINK